MDSIRKQVCTLIAIALVLLVPNVVIWDSIFRTPVPVLCCTPGLLEWQPHQELL